MNEWTVKTTSLEPGTYLGMCVGIVDLGTHRSQYEEEKTNPQLMLVFQLVSGEVVGKVVNQSWSKRSALRKLCEGWWGRALPDSFDILQLLNKRGTILLSLTKNGSVKVDRVGPVAQGTEGFFDFVAFRKPFVFKLPEKNAKLEDLPEFPDWLPFAWGKPVKEYLAESLELENKAIEPNQGSNQKEIPF